MSHSPAYDALLLVSFGGPERHEDVIPFLENVLRGRNVPRPAQPQSENLRDRDRLDAGELTAARLTHRHRDIQSDGQKSRQDVLLC